MAFSVACTELSGSPVERRGQDSFEATVQLECAWADRLTLRSELLGYYSTAPAGYGHLYPHSPAMNARCRNVTCAPLSDRISSVVSDPYAYGTTGERASYEKALVTAEYSTPTINTPQAPAQGGSPTEQVSECIEPSVRGYPLSATNLRWGAPNGAQVEPEEAPSLFLYTHSYRYSRHHLSPADAQSRAYWANSYFGLTNSSDIPARLLPITYAQGTLLLASLRIERVTGAGGTLEWTLEYGFEYNPNTHNKWLRGSTGTWDAMYEFGGAQFFPYPQTADFAGRLF